eukprot:397456_1
MAEIPISQLPHAPYWKPNSAYNLRIYLSEQEDLFEMLYGEDSEDYLAFKKSHIRFSCDDESFDEKEMNISTTKSLQNNGSYWAHIVINQFGYQFY